LGAVSSGPVGRTPGKPKKGVPYRLHIILPGEVVEDVDALVGQLKSEDPYGRNVTRTDAIRVLITEAVRARKKK
jgi:hypothetical protein